MAWGESYGSAWVKIRKQVLAREKCCRKCGSTERLEVDHIINKACGGTDDSWNLQVLCHPCHKRKTNQEKVAGLKRPRRSIKRTDTVYMGSQRKRH